MYRCELVAKVPRTWCRKDGVHQVQVPWARQGSGFTLMMEALMMLLSAEMPVDAMADLLGEHVRQHWDGILAYFDTRMTSAAIEAVNGTIQLAKRMARGFESFVYFRTAAYHRAGKLTLAVPTIA